MIALPWTRDYGEVIVEEVVKVPKGAESGMVLKFRHKGHYGVDGMQTEMKVRL